MALVTVQVLEGLERGQVFADLPTPITIGREDDNHIRLNDERVSRFHVKIQEDNGRIILTDLESTNGTRVNGHPVSMRVLQVGDQVSIGRCLMVFGTPEQILARYDGSHAESATPSEVEARAVSEPSELSDGRNDDWDFSLQEGMEGELPYGELFPDGPPPVPRELRPASLAELSDVLAYVHDQIRVILESALEVSSDDGQEEPEMVVDKETWHRLLQLEMNLAVYLRKIAEPEDR